MAKTNYALEAEVLAKTLAMNNIVLRHPEVLAKVAERHDAESWQTLVNRESFGDVVSRWLPRLGRSAAVSPRMSIQDVLYGARPADALSFGYCAKTGKPHALADNYLLRHTLILGSPGVGIHAMLECLMAQHMARGGGFLYLDPFGSAQTRDNLKQVAELTGTPFRQTSALDGELNLYNAVRAAEAILVSAPAMTEAEERTRQGAMLREELRSVLSRLGQEFIKKRPPHPFFIIMPNVRALGEKEWSVLLSHARAIGIGFFFIESSIADLRLAPEPVADSILQCTWNKVFFRANNALGVAHEAEFLQAYGPAVMEALGVPSSSAKEALLQLRLGEALLLTGGMGAKLHVHVLYNG
jgi:hypothetical protein